MCESVSVYVCIYIRVCVCIHSIKPYELPAGLSPELPLKSIPGSAYINYFATELGGTSSSGTDLGSIDFGKAKDLLKACAEK